MARKTKAIRGKKLTSAKKIQQKRPLTTFQPFTVPKTIDAATPVFFKT